ncbi:hypothetical protein U8335_02345 [Roseiconus lacunae]|uniref:hypothetical protein n=1 Tax=Roseiconus lacunae TaxID=2605694 RepID=UPI00308A71FB|nr:hypothetical protein U8335_02345 [Stieleria sp. HD01]
MNRQEIETMRDDALFILHGLPRLWLTAQQQHYESRVSAAVSELVENSAVIAAHRYRLATALTNEVVTAIEIACLRYKIEQAIPVDGRSGSAFNWIVGAADDWLTTFYKALNDAELDVPGDTDHFRSVAKNSDEFWHTVHAHINTDSPSKHATALHRVAMSPIKDMPGDVGGMVRKETTALLADNPSGLTLGKSTPPRANGVTATAGTDQRKQVQSDSSDIDRYEVGKLTYEYRNVDAPKPWTKLLPILSEHFQTKLSKTTAFRCMEEYCDKIKEQVPKQPSGRKKKPGNQSR